MKLILVDDSGAEKDLRLSRWSLTSSQDGIVLNLTTEPQLGDFSIEALNDLTEMSVEVSQLGFKYSYKREVR